MKTPSHKQFRSRIAAPALSLMLVASMGAFAAPAAWADEILDDTPTANEENTNGATKDDGTGSNADGTGAGNSDGAAGENADGTDGAAGGNAGGTSGAAGGGESSESGNTEKVTITFNYNGQGANMTSEVDKGVMVALPTERNVSGLKFKGWKNLATGEIVTDSFIADSDVTLEAQWAELVTIEFDANGHGTAPEAIEIEKGTAPGTLPVLEAEGWTFNGWLVDGKKFDESATVDEDVVLVASWTKVDAAAATKLATTKKAEAAPLAKKTPAAKSPKTSDNQTLPAATLALAGAALAAGGIATAASRKRNQQ